MEIEVSGEDPSSRGWRDVGAVPVSEVTVKPLLSASSGHPPPQVFGVFTTVCNEVLFLRSKWYLSVTVLELLTAALLAT